MSQAIAVRQVDASYRSGLGEIAALFTEAFDTNALFVKAFPRRETRRAAMRMLFDALVADAARFGGIHVAQCDAVVGALLWYPPGAYPITGARIARQIHRFLAMLARSPSGVFELHRAQDVFDRRRPREPHCHASFLAGRAGERVSLQLARALIAHADANDWPIYLETQNLRSVALYQRMGCELISDGFECFPGGPITWTMWRPPGVVAQRSLHRASRDDAPPLAAE